VPALGPHWDEGVAHQQLAEAMLGAAPVLTARDLAARLGFSVDEVLRLRGVMGFPVAGPDDPVFIEADLQVYEALAFGAEVVGAEGTEQFARVLSSALLRVADAAMALARNNLTGPLRAEGAAPEELLDAGRRASAALAGVPDILGTVFRHHALAAQKRSFLGREGLPAASYDRALLLVGFTDVVGSTVLHEATDPGVLARAVADFEAAAVDALVAEGGRVIKHIGDEAMYLTPDAAGGCRAALALTEMVGSNPVLTQARTALSFGEVIPQDGDVYGTVVNIAARATTIAQPGQVLVTAAVQEACTPDDGLVFRPGGSHQLRGVEAPVELFEVDWG
jgi:adenylate cyclase